jgi:hypothetical protein
MSYRYTVSADFTRFPKDELFAIVPIHIIFGLRKNSFEIYASFIYFTGCTKTSGQCSLFRLLFNTLKKVKYTVL